MWCNENNLSLNVKKTKELIINFRKKGEHAPIYISGAEVEKLRKFGMSIRTLNNFYRCTIESILSVCIMAWYGNCSAQDSKKLQKEVCTAQNITEANLPSMETKQKLMEKLSRFGSICEGKNRVNVS
eukprot:g36897.t1